MKRGVILALIYIMSLMQVKAYELVLPKEKKTDVTSNYAFFVGKAQNSESIVINDHPVYTASNGAFAHSVKLKDGENRIIVRSNFNTQIYKFYKKKLISKKAEELCDFDLMPVVVKKDNTPLRKTPVDAGMNRISHLFEGTTLLVNGAKDGFYKVLLSKDNIAWVAQKDVEVCCDKIFKPANFINMDSQRFKNATVQTIAFSKNLPYTVEERESEIVFKVYNPELTDTSFYTLNIPKPPKYTYQVKLEDGMYTFKVSSVPYELEDCTIVIDAGHGGTERGAVGCLGDEEKNINLRIALELYEKLKLLGADVLMTRECDGNISLEERVEFAKKNNADIFVSIHLNSIGDKQMNIHKDKGTSVFYYNPEAKALAKSVQNSLTKAIKTRDDGVKEASFAVIRPSEYIGILVETAYMTNPFDSVLYRSENFAEDVAQGIADGILEFVRQ